MAVELTRAMLDLKALLERAAEIEEHLHGKFKRDREYVLKHNRPGSTRKYTNENGVPINRPIYPSHQVPANTGGDGRWHEDSPSFENIVRAYEDCA